MNEGERNRMKRKTSAAMKLKWRMRKARRVMKKKKRKKN